MTESYQVGSKNSSRLGSKKSIRKCQQKNQTKFFPITTATTNQDPSWVMQALET